MSNRSRTAKFFQFPVNLLHIATPIDAVSETQKRDAMRDIFTFCRRDVVELLRAKYCAAEYGAAELAGWGFPAGDAGKCTTAEIEGADDVVVENLAMCKTLGIFASAESFERWVKDDQSNKVLEYGQTQVRISTRIFFDAFNSWKWRDFAVLMAVNAAVGADRASLVRKSRLHALSVGFSSIDEVRRHGADAWQLSDRQLRHTLRKLRLRGFFRQGSPDRRSWFYSTRLNDEEFCSYVANLSAKRTKRPTPLEMTDTIRRKIKTGNDAARRQEDRHAELETRGQINSRRPEKQLRGAN